MLCYSHFLVAPLPFSPCPSATSCPNAIKLLAARRDNGEMSLTTVVIAGACRALNRVSTFCAIGQTRFLFSSRFPGDRAIPPPLPFQIPLLFSLAEFTEILRNSGTESMCTRRRGQFITISLLSNASFPRTVYITRCISRERAIFRILFRLKRG